MLTEVPAALAAHTDLFPDPQARHVLAAVAAGNSRARLWRAAAGPAALLWDQANNVLYLQHLTPADLAGLFPLLRAAALELGRPRLSLRVLDGDPAPLLAVLPGPAPAAATRRFYAHPGPAPEYPAAEAGTHYVPITAAWLAGPPLANLDQVRAEVLWMWPSLERFAADGFGIAAVRDGAVVCWCTAEYVSAAECGLGIETAAAWQGQGLATAAAVRCTALSWRLGRAPHWECDHQNQASIRVAEKAGFVPAGSAPAWLVRLR